MKSVVMIAYFFPPEGSAGSFRPLRFIQQLSKSGWRTSVVTVSPYRYERYDPDLLNQIPNETEIIRARERDLWQAVQARRMRRIQETLLRESPQIAGTIRAAHNKPFRSRIREIVRTVEAFHYRPDMARPWIRSATKAATNLCMQKQADILWATAGPVSAWVVARQVSERTGVPYVLDLRDPHGLSYYDEEIRQPTWVQRKNRQVMYQLFKGARSVVFLFESVAESYCHAFPGALDVKKIHIIPNGYEGTIEEFTLPDEEKFTVLYSGTLSSYRYDTFLQALSMLQKANPTKARSFRFRFVGEDTEGLSKQAAELGLANIVETVGPTSFAESTRLQRQSHALLIFGRPSTKIGHELVAGAKLFSYLKARKPILGVLPADETRKILRRLSVTTIADADSPQDILSLLQRVFDAWSSGDLSSLLPDLDACDVYSAQRQTAALARALEGLPMEQPFFLGARELPRSLRARIRR